MIKKWKMPEAGKKYQKFFEKYENRYSLPRNLLARIAQQESAYNPNAISNAGAQGLMQIVPHWHPEVSDPYDPDQAIMGAALFLCGLYRHFGDWRLCLAAYNFGQANVEKHNRNIESMPTETRNYVKSISADIDFNQLSTNS